MNELLIECRELLDRIGKRGYVEDITEVWALCNKITEQLIENQETVASVLADQTPVVESDQRSS